MSISGLPILKGEHLRQTGNLRMWQKYAIAAVAVGIVAVLPLIKTGAYFQLQVEIVLIYVMATVGLNVAFGYAGEFFLIQPAVLAISAYVTAVLTTEQHWSLWGALPAALILGTIGGIAVGLPGLRIRGLYLGLISFFGLLVISDLPLIWPGTLGSTDGLIGVPSFAGGGLRFYELTVGGLVLVLVGVWNLMRSSWGLRLRALRDAPNALVATGFAAGRTRITVYGLSSFVGSLAGWYLAQANGSVIPSAFSLNLILILFAGVIVGGPGTLIGPVIGAAILEGYTQFVGAFSAYNVVGLGLLLFAVIVLAPSGVRNQVERWRPQLFGKQKLPNIGRSDVAHDDLGAHQSISHPPKLRFHNHGLAIGLVDELQKYGADARGVIPDHNNGAVPALEVTGLRKSFGSVEVLRGVDLSIGNGQIVGLLGTNGSGKTTLVNVVTGLLQADRATIKVQGRDVTGRSAARRAQAGMARTFQVPQLVLDLSVRENIELGTAYRLRDSLLASVVRTPGCRRRAAERREIVKRVCAILGLPDEIADTKASLLPLGVRRVVEVGRAMAAGAQVICLDEPAAGLEEKELPTLADALSRLARAGRGLLLIEHHLGFLMTVADSVLLLSDGRVVERADNLSAEHLPPLIAEYVREVPL